MERNEFDERLRDLLDGATETAPDVWEGIARGLDRRRKLVILRRFSVAAAAAAAMLAIALLVFRGPRTGNQVVAPVETAQVSPVTIDEVPMASIEEQIATFTQHQAVAQAKPVRTFVQPVAPAQPQPVVETPVAEEAPVADAPAETPAAVSAAQPAVVPVDEEAGKLGAEDLPADFWTADEASASRTRTHTSQISILSNLTTVSSEGGLFYKPGAMHSSSQSGKGGAYSLVEPVDSSPKFYMPLTFGLRVDFSLTDRLSIGTGLTYTYLVSRYDLLYNKVRFEDAYNQLHYVGMPLSLSYHFVQTRRVGVYASVAGAVEKCVSQRYVIGSETPKDAVRGVQWSTQAGVGVEFWFVPRVGIYFDPSLAYFFDNSQPLSIRTHQPLQAKLEAGFRFKI